MTAPAIPLCPTPDAHPTTCPCPRRTGETYYGQPITTTPDISSYQEQHVTQPVNPQFGIPDCTCIPFTRQSGPPRYCQPGDTVDMISGWEIGRDCPHHRRARTTPDNPAASGDTADNPDVSELEFTRRVLDVFAKADCFGELLWHLDGGQIKFCALVNDVFAWGGADGEDITPDRLPVLEQAYADLKAICATEHTAELYAARIRGERPQGAAYPTIIPARALFDACGPERETGLGNPRPRPSDTGDPVAALPDRAQAAIRALEQQRDAREEQLDAVREYVKTSDDDGIRTRERVLLILGPAGGEVGP